VITRSSMTKQVLQLKSLEPMKRKLGSSTNHAATGTRNYRYLHTLFAYAIDITAAEWAANELAVRNMRAAFRINPSIYYMC
jgi:hypothetical protein